MNNFNFQCGTKIIFGRDTQKETGKNTAKFSKNILFVYGGGSIKKSGLYDEIVASLEESGVSFTELSGVKPNPVLSLVREGIEICREKNIDFILAVGGGSVVDTAKTIALGVPYEGDVWDFFEGKARAKRVLPVGCVITIPAAGSECSPGSVITNEETKDKNSYGNGAMRPQFSILNPALTCTLSNYQTACGASDIMAHVMERYFTNTEHVELSDRLCESVLKTVISNLPIVLKDNENYDARAELMWAGTLAHNGLVGAGREEDWGNHDMEHPLSAFYDIAHGAGLAVLFPAWMKYIWREKPKKMLQFATNVMNIDYNPYQPEATIVAGIRAFEQFLNQCGLVTRLRDLGIDETHFEEMADKCTKNGSATLGNYRRLAKDDVIAIYKLAL